MESVIIFRTFHLLHDYITICLFIPAHNPNADVVFHVLNNSTLLSKPEAWKILTANSKQSAVGR